VRLEVKIKAHIVGMQGDTEGGVERDLLHVSVMVGVSWFIFDIGGGGLLAERWGCRRRVMEDDSWSISQHGFTYLDDLFQGERFCRWRDAMVE
jgi:hypothetical protein